MTIDEEIREAIRTRRLGLNWSQAELAEAAGCSKTSVQLIETARRWPSAGMLRDLFSALGLHDVRLYLRSGER